MTEEYIHKTLRHATLEDVPELLTMGETLFKDSPYSVVSFDLSRARQHLEKFIIEGNEEYLCLISHDEGKSVGVIAAYAFKPLFSSDKVAVECLWWLSPEYRESRRGKEMMEAYEYWAKAVGCRVVQYGLLSSSPKGMDKLYERNGAVPSEYVYTKKLR